MKWHTVHRENGRIEFTCKHGIGHYAHWYKDAMHGCDGCCRREDFPGRLPRVGDLALCGHGILGLITVKGPQVFTYPDGNTKKDVFLGFRLYDYKLDRSYLPQFLDNHPVLWSSINPCVIGDEGHDLVRSIAKGGCFRSFVEEHAPEGWL